MKRTLIAIAITLAVGFLLGGYAGYRYMASSSEKKAAAFFAEGQRYFDAQRYPEAAERFNRSVALNPGLDSAHVMLSNVYQKMGLSELAKRELEAGGVIAGQ